MTRLLMGWMGLAVAASQCSNPELDLCPSTTNSPTEMGHAADLGSPWLGLLLPAITQRSPAMATLAIVMGVNGAQAAHHGAHSHSATCNEVVTFYQAQNCCGQPTQALDFEELRDSVDVLGKVSWEESALRSKLSWSLDFLCFSGGLSECSYVLPKHVEPGVDCHNFRPLGLHSWQPCRRMWLPSCQAALVPSSRSFLAANFRAASLRVLHLVFFLWEIRGIHPHVVIRLPRQLTKYKTIQVARPKWRPSACRKPSY